MGLLRLLYRGLAAVFFVGAACFIGAIAGLVGLGPKLGPRTIRWAGLWVLRSTGVNATVEGLEHVPQEGGFVLISNHESHYDGPFLCGWFPRDFTIVAKTELFRIPIMGAGFRGFGFIEVNRADHAQSMQEMDAATRHLQQGGVVLVFPEGHRTESGDIQEFKKGGFVMALKAQVPLIPAAIAGTREVLPWRSVNIRSGRVHLLIGPPIPVAGRGLEDRDALLAEAQDTIADLRRRAKATLKAESEAHAGS